MRKIAWLNDRFVASGWYSKLRTSTDQIAKLKKELTKIEKERATQGHRRKEKFRVALVGYTNAGKSTLMNAITGADVYIRDQLFATLDTTIRSTIIDDEHEILLSDTVGFIRKLPHHLIASFRSTLQEVLGSRSNAYCARCFISPNY